MSKKMLIEATHPEETRVVVLDESRLEELDVETSTKKQIKGNIYLAKVVRVEPSLQAAFVEYGGNRHGFLAFNEIHPDYYQIPAADLEALKKEMFSHVERDNDDDEEVVAKQAKEDEDVETVSEDNDDAMYRPRRFALRKYRIQEVIHHGQKMLVQVTKEERGNKGAAVTTYLSLAGRYSVLMPKNAHSGGVSRKIANVVDRKRLKKIVESLPVLEGQSVIIRTAGKERTKAEIKRDFEYLNKTWETIVETTMQSIAPALIHEEANLIKRTLRDAMTDDIEEILIEGEDSYKNAKAFLKLLMPKQIKKIKEYKKEIPLFQAYNIEKQMEEMLQKTVHLKSGGYLVIDQAEALVAIDVNSGRATRERNIEETALKTNLEAAEEVARQLRLRDLAGLIVIDFIDMDEPKNNYAVERKMKEALKKDRARIQMGHITGFGLMELSRQRLRSSLLETGHHVCPMCQGAGFVRSGQSSSMHVLHVLEEAAQYHPNHIITITIPLQIALYVLNNKREALGQIESRHGVQISVDGDASLLSPTDFRLEYKALPAKEKGFFARTIDSLLGKNTEAHAQEKKEVKENKSSVKAERKAPEKKAKPVKEEKKENKSSKKEKTEPQKAKKKLEEKVVPVLDGQENFKVVHQEAMIVYDEHATSIVPVEDMPVVAVEPAKTVVESVAKPKKTRSKKETQSKKKTTEQKSSKKAEKLQALKEKEALENNEVSEPIILPAPQATQEVFVNASEDVAMSVADVTFENTQSKEIENNLKQEDEVIVSDVVVQAETSEAPKTGWWNKEN